MARFRDMAQARMGGGQMGSQMLGQQARRMPQAGMGQGQAPSQGGAGMQPVGMIQGNLSAHIIKMPEQNQQMGQQGAMMGQQGAMMGQRGVHDAVRTGELAKASMRPQEEDGRGLAQQIADELRKGGQGLVQQDMPGGQHPVPKFLGQEQAQGNAFAGQAREAQDMRSGLSQSAQNEMAMRRQADAGFQGGPGGMLGGRGFFG